MALVTIKDKLTGEILQFATARITDHNGKLIVPVQGFKSDLHGDINLPNLEGKKVLFTYVGYAPLLLSEEEINGEVYLEKSNKSLDTVIILGKPVQKKHAYIGLFALIFLALKTKL